MDWSAITTSAEVDRLVTAKASESEVLDFKAKPWSDGEEAAKDVAAFANAMGGTILVGIAEDGQSRAEKVVALEEGEQVRRRVADWLGQQLEPREVAARAKLELIPVEGGTVLAVNVPPWPGAPVSVGWSKSQGALRFPVRRDRQTDFMTAGEVFVRGDVAKRAKEIRLGELLGTGGKLPVVVGSEVAVRVFDRRGELSAPPNRAHAIARLSEGTLVLEMRCEGAARHLVSKLQESFAASFDAALNEMATGRDLVGAVVGSVARSAMLSQQWDSPGGTVTVPLDVVRSVADQRRTEAHASPACEVSARLYAAIAPGHPRFR